MNILMDKMAAVASLCEGPLNLRLCDLFHSSKVIVLHAKVILVSECGSPYEPDALIHSSDYRTTLHAVGCQPLAGYGPPRGLYVLRSSYGVSRQ